MPVEKIGDVITVLTADHPPRKDSPIYVATRKWLMSQTSGGCMVCGGPPDLAHPEVPADAVALRLEDHHGGGIHYKGLLVALNLFPLEWSQGWAADPKVIAGFVAMLNGILQILGEPTYDGPITTTAEVMAYVDSRWNANTKICKSHHTGHQSQHTPDVHGHEACGIHNIPFPIWAGQITCEWARFDMFGGSTGTVAVAPHPEIPGATVVLHADPAHPIKQADGSALTLGTVLPPTHPHSRAGHAGYRTAVPVAT